MQLKKEALVEREMWEDKVRALEDKVEQLATAALMVFDGAQRAIESLPADAGKASSALDTAENRSRNTQLERSSSMRVSLLRSKMISRNSVHPVNSVGKLRRRFLVKSMRYTGWPAALAAWALSMLV